MSGRECFCHSLTWLYYVNSYYSLFSGHFLYLLGWPPSSNESLSDKRLISSLIKETGNNCKLEAFILYHKILGANIEVATQNVAKAYMPISNLVIQKENDSSHGS